MTGGYLISIIIEIIARIAKWLRHRLLKPTCAGSNPAAGANFHITPYEPYQGKQFDFDRDVAWGTKQIDPQILCSINGLSFVEKRHIYYMSLVWDDGHKQVWSPSIRVALIAYNAVLDQHPYAIGAVVGLRITLR